MLSGIFDIFSHLMEQYFSNEDDNVSDYLLEGLMKSLTVVTPLALKDPRNYEARSNIMWAASIALNGIAGVSKLQDWEVHGIEHQISAYINCAHGIGLASISVNYYKAEYKYGLAKFVRFAINVLMLILKKKAMMKLLYLVLML
jgi:butanol dehydrogenase